MADVLQIFTTVADRDAADRIALELIEQRLAACVQILGPMKSVFRWQGKVDSSDEWLCIIKTRASRYAAVEAAILKVHPYEVPEIVAVPIVAAAARYREWLEAEVMEN